MKYVLWLLQILVAVAFLGAGFMKLTAPIDELAQTMTWVTALPVWLVRFIGLVEIAGALGLVLPALTRIQPQLTPLAGAALVLVMLLATVFHIVRGEFGLVLPNIVLMVLAGLVAYGRGKLLPISPKPA
ncbi:MAG: DoxX family protein [Litorilinea sp.]